jgi:hypothetical protein
VAAGTPWGTIVTAEENFNQYFANRDTCPDAFAKTNHTAYGIPAGASERRWENAHPRFNTADAGYVNEPFRFGWIVEYNPYDPTSVPRKRTALGRVKHEAAAGVRAANGKYVAYMGDDERFQFLYKFVTTGTVDSSTTFDSNLLDSGTLYVARFDADTNPADPGDGGSGQWLPLVFGQGPLAAPAFANQADVLIRCRQAAAALGATPMDRPEDVEVNPVDGKVYMACTNNSNRTAAQIDGRHDGETMTPAERAPTTRTAPQPRSTGPTPGPTTGPVTSSRSRSRAGTTPPPPSPGTSSCCAANRRQRTRTSPATTRPR